MEFCKVIPKRNYYEPMGKLCSIMQPLPQFEVTLGATSRLNSAAGLFRGSGLRLASTYSRHFRSCFGFNQSCNIYRKLGLS